MGSAFAYDGTNGYVGINSNTPASRLEINGAGSTSNIDGIRLRQPNVAHGITGSVPTDVYAVISWLSSTAGGLLFHGLSDTDAVALELIGTSGSTTPTTATIEIRGRKKSGTGVAALASTEILYQATNNGTVVSRMMANGYLGLNMTSSPLSVIEINGDGSTSSVDGVRLRQPNVAHGMTGIVPTDVYGVLSWGNSNAGGVLLRGLSDTDAVGAFLIGINGSTSPTTAAIEIRGSKKSGTTQQALASTEILATYTNNGTVAGTVYGDGSYLYADGANQQYGTGTGTKHGTATNQKLSFWNAVPIIQPTTAIAAAVFVANTSGIANDSATFDGYTIGQVVKALRNVGLLA
jgi:hypothetical protein